MNLLSMLFATTLLSLDGPWNLSYFPQPDAGAIRSPDIPSSIEVKSVPATVPGNCELDLVRAGLAPNPEIGTNSYAFRSFEGNQWLYTKKFKVPLPDPQHPIPNTQHPTPNYVLVFDGVDTFADVFLNGEKVGETANMLIPHRFDVTKKLRDGENVVQVLIRSAFLETRDMTLGELGRTMTPGPEGELIRKAAHMGGWDIFPRLFANGIWRGVRLEVEEPSRIGNTAYFTTFADPTGRVARVTARYSIHAPFVLIDKAKVRVSLSRNGTVVHEYVNKFRHFHNEHRFTVKDAALWWPRGMGEAALYDAKIELLDESGTVLAEKSEKIGLRTIRLDREDIVPEKSEGEFLFRVNGEKVFIRGTNWVPMDAFHGRDAQHLDSAQAMLADLNCNMVRMWGGGVYEPDSFYDFCDREGILVWQDLMTASGLYPQSDEYAALTRMEIQSVALRLRNHPSLAIWCGNNENDFAPTWNFGSGLFDPNRDRTSRRTIPEVLYEFDPLRPYLPSSPYMSPEDFRGTARHSEEHIWSREYYKGRSYLENRYKFISEMGYHGCPNRASLERMMTKECVYPWVGDGWTWNREWQCKACVPFDDPGHDLVTRNNVMLKKIRMVFGEVSRDLDDFVLQSQFVQAEALKTWMERYRIDKFNGRNGLLWWNLRDGWPIVSDAVVDYYGGKKLAYAALKDVQGNQLVAVKDDGSVWAVNATRHAVDGITRIVDRVSGKELFQGPYRVPANASARIGTVSFSGQGLLDITWTCDGAPGRNHFLYGAPPFNWPTVKSLLHWDNGRPAR